MKTVTVHFGARHATIEIPAEATVESIVGNNHLKALLGFPDNVGARYNNVSLEAGVVVPTGATLYLEPRANEKGV